MLQKQFHLQSSLTFCIHNKRHSFKLVSRGVHGRFLSGHQKRLRQFC